MQLDLPKDNPSLYAQLLRAQPFSNKKKALSKLRELANLGKHVHLAQQTRKSSLATRARLADGSTVTLVPPVDFKAKEYSGMQIDSETIEQVNWVEFSVDGHDIGEPVIFCLSLLTGFEKYLSTLLSHV